MDYTEAIIKDVLCRGLGDTEIQMDLLGDKNQDMTLEQVLRFVKAKEAGKRSASRLLLPQATDAVTGSSYRRQKKPSAKGSPPKIKTAARTVGPEGTEEAPQQESGELNAQPLVPSATVVTKTTTSRRCVGANMIQGRQKTLNKRTQYSTHYARSHQQTAPKYKVWMTIL